MNLVYEYMKRSQQIFPKYHRLWFFLFCLVFPILLFCQDFKFDHFGLDQGFDASQALSIKKAKDGYVWIGTENGLYRFDGHQFKAYLSDLTITKGFSGNYFNHISIDRYNRVWMSAGTNSLNVFDIERNEIIRYEDDEIALGQFIIYNIFYEAKNDVTWINSSQGLYYSQGENVCLHRYPIDGYDNYKVGGYFTMDSTGNFWMANEQGIIYYNQEACTLKVFKNPYNKTRIVNVDDFQTISNEGDSILWIGGRSSGLFKYNIKNNTWKKYNWSDPTKFNNGVNMIQPMKSNSNFLWVATYAGLQTFDKEREKFISYSSDNIYDPYTVPGICFSFDETESEGLWIGTWKGLHRYDPFKQFIKNINIPEIKDNGTTMPYGINFERNATKRDSIIWFFLPYGEVFRYDIIRQKMLSIPPKLLPYCKGQIEPQYTFIDSKNRLWISTYKRGLIGYDLTKNELIKPRYDYSKIKRIVNIEEDSKGQLWFGCYSGLYKLDGNSLVHDAYFSAYLEKINASPYCYGFTMDKSDHIWHIPFLKVGNSSTIIKYDIAQKNIVSYEAKDNKVLAKLDHIQAVLIYDTNRIVVTSYHGFAIGEISKNGLDLIYHDKINGHFINGTHDIVVDDNNIYISSDLGIVKCSKKDNFKNLFTYSNSNLGATTSPSLTYSEESNTIYISQEQNLQYLHSNDIPKNKSPHVLLSSLKINDSIVTFVPKSGDKIALTHQQNTLHMSFSNLNFTNANTNVYEYKLDKMQDWQRTIGNILNFEKMQSGSYSLQVRATNSFNIRSENNFVLSILISAPWYQTWWFQSCIIMMISAIIYSLFKYRDLQRQKVEKLRISIARDLHDDMGSTLSHIRMMSEREAMRKEANQSFKTIADKTAEVMNNMTEIIWSINPKNDNLKNIIGKIQEFAIDTLEPLGIEIHFDIDDVSSNIKLNPEDRRHFYLIFKEAINNTAKYSKANQVHFAFKTEKGKTKTMFTDDGTGFDPMMIKHGNGLKNMESRGSALHGKIIIETNEKGTAISLLL